MPDYEFLGIRSNDRKFMVRLISWLNSQKPEQNTETVIYSQSTDPVQELRNLKSKLYHLGSS